METATLDKQQYRRATLSSPETASQCHGQGPLFAGADLDWPVKPDRNYEGHTAIVHCTLIYYQPFCHSTQRYHGTCRLAIQGSSPHRGSVQDRLQRCMRGQQPLLQEVSYAQHATTCWCPARAGNRGKNDPGGPHSLQTVACLASLEWHMPLNNSA